MTPEAIENLFTRSTGEYVFARWGRPIAPIVFGVQDETLALVKGACEAVVALAGHKMSETDSEIGANLMVFFFRDWDELLDVPNLDRLVDGLSQLVSKLKRANANQYRVFRFDDANAIQACFVFIRMDKELEAIPADALALGQIVNSILLWSDEAFRAHSPLATLPENGAVVLRPEIAAVIKAAYDPVIPAAAHDASHALRLFARIDRNQ